MRDLNFQLKKLCQHNRDGSYQTQANRYHMLQQMANQLYELGYHQMKAHSLKPKHIQALVNAYQQQQLSTGVIKNRLSVLRWWADKINKNGIMAKDNAAYGIENRIYVTNTSKAKSLESDRLQKINCPYVKASLQLQQAFGLRREEAIKIMPGQADKGTHLQLKATWCKGGRARVIPIYTQQQRETLDKVKQLAKTGGLIPSHLNYIKQLKIYERETNNVGLHKMHGLRHAYAQQRYLELTGRQAPACAEQPQILLSHKERQADKEARQIISQELGHEREQITAVYLGR